MILVAEQVRLFVVLTVGLLLIGGLFRGKSAAIRHQSYRCLLCVTGIMPFIGIGFAIFPGVPVATVSPAIVRRLPDWTPPSVMPKGAQEIRETRASDPAESQRDVIASGILVALQCGGVLILGIPGFRSWRRLRRLEGAARSLEPFEGIPVLRANEPGLGVPVTYGGPPRILLPQDSEDWPEDRVRAALLHEAAHVRRKDWSWQQCAGVFRLLTWFNPAVHLLARALRDTAEEAADDEVLERMRSSDYARELLAVSARLGGRPTAGVAMVGHKGVASRVRSILAVGRDRRRTTVRWTLAAAAFVGILTLGFGAATTRMRRDRLPSIPGAVTSVPGRLTYLPNGAFVELERIARYDGGRLQSWSRLGYPLPSSEVDRQSTRVIRSERRYLTFHVHTPDPKVEGTPSTTMAKDPGIVGRLPSGIEDGPGWVYALPRAAFRAEGGSSYELHSQTIESVGLTSDVAVGVALGPRRFRRRVAVPHPVEATSPDGAHWILATVPRDLKATDRAYLVIDAQGRRYPARGVVREIEPETSVSLDFKGPKTLRIVAVEIAYRPYQWVVFRDVRLEPNADVAWESLR